jgi:hypothetical protein
LVLLLIDAVGTIIEMMLRISGSPDGLRVWKGSVSDFDIPGKHDRGSLSYLSLLLPSQMMSLPSTIMNALALPSALSTSLKSHCE